MNFITEAKMIYSDRFETILKKIGTPLALDFLSLKQKDFGGAIKQNRLDIDPTKDDVVKFIPDQKTKDDIDMEYVVDVPATIIDNNYVKYSSVDNLHFRKILFQKMNLPFEETTEYPRRIPNGTKGKIVAYLDRSDMSSIIMYGNSYGICYFKSDQGGVFIGSPGIEKDFHLGISTQEMKIGRFITRILPSFPNVYSAKDIEEFVNSYKSQIAKLNDIFSNFKIVEGDDIRRWYHESKYNKTAGGPLNGSCMRYAQCGPYFGIYCQNPSRVKLVILTNDDEQLIGRALLWTLDDGKIFMDRVYYIKDSIANLFKDYAIHNQWHYKESQNSSSYSGGIYFNGRPAGLSEIIVTLDNVDGISQYPYMDTLCFLRKDGNTYILSNEHGDYCLHSTGGSICGDCDGDGDSECDECSGRGTFDCDSCDGSGSVDCDRCDGSGHETCDECRSGKIECSTCGGSGEEENEEGNMEECTDCSGSGEIDCPDCDGSGEVTCERCDGDGTETCGDCDGDGDTSCDNCHGEGSFRCNHGAQ